MLPFYSVMVEVKLPDPISACWADKADECSATRYWRTLFQNLMPTMKFLVSAMCKLLRRSDKIISDVGHSACWWQQRVEKCLWNSIIQTTQVLECIADIKESWIEHIELSARVMNISTASTILLHLRALCRTHSPYCFLWFQSEAEQGHFLDAAQEEPVCPWHWRQCCAFE